MKGFSQQYRIRIWNGDTLVVEFHQRLQWSTLRGKSRSMRNLKSKIWQKFPSLTGFEIDPSGPECFGL